ncbi:hypothetical protein K443DRAFT_672420 [Laccaria amethystina LaAM-08-1]|uniref:Uncharacterized protein n=1 Tax=Laccaria amethystina LaAM-08-1 TaxID=1095629 RepID=A0A0C9YK00_9AGAR|nr:hypothetical protein K443DRAFT_672420 [Laccaria amethystina LaAM-08-1]
MHPDNEAPRSTVTNHRYFHKSVYSAPVGPRRCYKTKVEATGMNHEYLNYGVAVQK